MRAHPPPEPFAPPTLLSLQEGQGATQVQISTRGWAVKTRTQMLTRIIDAEPATESGEPDVLALGYKDLGVSGLTIVWETGLLTNSPSPLEDSKPAVPASCQRRGAGHQNFTWRRRLAVLSPCDTPRPEVQNTPRHHLPEQTQRPTGAGGSLELLREAYSRRAT